MAQQPINTGTLPNDKTGDSIRTAMIKIQNNFTELYTTAPIANSVTVGDANSSVSVNSTTVLIGNNGVYSYANSTTIITSTGIHSQVLNSGSNNLVIGTTNATSILVYTNGITSANQRMIVAANGNVGIGNGAPSHMLTVAGNISANQVIVGGLTINSTFIPATANYALLANNTNFVGSVSAANVVSNAQLSANLANYVTTTNLSNNLANYQTSAGLASNVQTLTSNNTSFVGSLSATEVVSNSQLSANLANYQTSAGLSANVATLTANYALSANLANNSNFLGGVPAASYTNTSGSYVITGTHTYNANLTVNTAAFVVSNSSVVMTVNTNGIYLGNSSANLVIQRTGITQDGSPFGLPAGTVIYSAAQNAPSGFLKADGSAVSRSTYSNLFAAIGTLYGAGNGSTTFNLPDLRGRFIRSWADNGTIDSGRSFGSNQSDAFGSHSHTTSLDQSNLPGGSSGVCYNGGGNGTIGPGNVPFNFKQFTMSNTGDTETRPTNIALLACIKF